MKVDDNTMPDYPRAQLKAVIGKLRGKDLRFAVQFRKCEDVDCKVRNVCHYKKTGRCMFEMETLWSLFMKWVDLKEGIGDLLDEFQLHEIGDHLMPLYQQKLHFEMDIRGLTKPTFVNDKGDIRAYPQYKEFRETLKMIMLMEQNIGLKRLWKEKFGIKKVLPSGKEFEDVLLNGEPGAYEAMAGTSMELDTPEEAEDQKPEKEINIFQFPDEPEVEDE